MVAGSSDNTCTVLYLVLGGCMHTATQSGLTAYQPVRKLVETSTGDTLASTLNGADIESFVWNTVSESKDLYLASGLCNCDKPLRGEFETCNLILRLAGEWHG